MEKYAIFPWSLPQACAQYRLDLWANTRHTYIVQAVDSDNWAILKRDLPQRFVQSLDALNEMVENIIMRAGVRIRFAYAHTCYDIKKCIVERESVIADMVNDMAERHGAHTDSVVITAQEWLSKLQDPLHVYKDNILYVILLDMLGRPEHDDDWPWKKEDIWKMAIIQRGYPHK